MQGAAEFTALDGLGGPGLQPSVAEVEGEGAGATLTHFTILSPSGGAVGRHNGAQTGLPSANQARLYVKDLVGSPRAVVVDENGSSEGKDDLVTGAIPSRNPLAMFLRRPALILPRPPDRARSPRPARSRRRHSGRRPVPPRSHGRAARSDRARTHAAGGTHRGGRPRRPRHDGARRPAPHRGLRRLAQDAGLTLLLDGDLDGTLTARWDRLPLDRALDALLAGSPYTYRRDSLSVTVGPRQRPAMATHRLVRLAHVPAEELVEQVPPALAQATTIGVAETHNALVVSGPADAVDAVERFVRTLDEAPTQVLIEVLVVEFETSGLRETSLSLLGGILPAASDPPDTDPGWASYAFGTGLAQRGELDVTADSEGLRRALNVGAALLGLQPIGRLPSDFYVRLRALEYAGYARVRSRPHVATLNGRTASISVGTAQYYRLQSSSRYGVDAGGVFASPQVERFEAVEATVEVDVTPWVGADGTVTAEVQPSFATPLRGFAPPTPPGPDAAPVR